MDPPLCGSAAMSHNEFQSREPIEPQEASPMKQEMHVLGIDIAKHVFHAVGMDDRGNVVYRKRVSRHDLIPFLAKLPPVRIGIEACGGAHYWARRFRAYGHEVKLMAPQFVKPYVKSGALAAIPGQKSASNMLDQWNCRMMPLSLPKKGIVVGG